MRDIFRIIFPAALLAGGLYFLRQSFRAYGLWHEHLAIGDPSGAELYEFDFQLQLPPALFFLVAGSFIAGRWWITRR